MKTNNKTIYFAPALEVEEIRVETGFAASPVTTDPNPGWEGGDVVED